METVNIRAQILDFFKEMKAKGTNHVFSSDFYAWLKKKGIEVTAEIRKAFREFVAACPKTLGTAKTSYKSNKTYIFFKSVGLKIRSYISKKWQPIYNKLKELHDSRAPKLERWKLWEKLQKCSFPGKTEKEIRMILAAAQMRT